MPTPIEIGQSLVYDRASLFAAGALTLQDLLDRVPGITGLRSGWIASPMASAFVGDVRRVRLFFDGLAYDEIDPRTGGIVDLSQVQLWSLEELRIERGATEVRVYLRSWRVDRTTPYSRTDIGTGDQQTNIYRGFFGRRYRPGHGFQLGAQQYGTTPPRRGSPSSDQLSLLARVGWARRGFSLDAFALRTSRNRGEVDPQSVRGASLGFDSIPPLKSTRLDAYVRAGIGDPERGLWFQAIAGALDYRIQNRDANSSAADTTIADTARFRAQYVAAAGFTRAGFHLDVAERLRIDNGHRLATPSARAEFISGPFALSAFADGRGPDSLARAEVVGRLNPLSFVSLLGAVGRSEERRTGDTTLYTNFMRGEAGLRVFGVWLSGGLIRRDSTPLAAPIVFSKSYLAAESEKAIGTIAAIRGPIFKAVRANVMAIRWNDSSGFYRPRYQTRSELYIATNWLSRFPSGNFGILVSGVHEYRSATNFPVQIGAQQGVVTVPDSRIYNFQLEIRIVTAVLSYQFRNIVGEQYQLLPGYMMPRQTQFYGVRWEFWN